MMVVLAIAAIALILSAIFIASHYEGSTARAVLGLLILFIFLLVLVFASLLFLEILRLLLRHKNTGPTQRRLVTLFVLMALIPTILVAIFSTVTMNVGLENWFSSRVKNVVDSSYDAALAYAQEHDDAIHREGDLVYGNFINDYNQFKALGLVEQNLSISEQIRETNGDLTIGNASLLRETLNNSIAPVVETIQHAFIISGNGEIISRGNGSYLFNYNKPTVEELQKAFEEETVIIKDLLSNEFRYLRTIDVNLGYYLYISRSVDGKILSLLNQTEETAKFYRDSEQSRQRLLVWFGAFYLAAAIVILMLAIWAALYFAARLTRPISRLVRTVERISEGDLDARVMEVDDNDEFSLLSRSFNQMTSDVQSNQLALKRASDASEAESRRFNNVLEGVSSGVIGTDSKGKITFINSSALKLLAVDKIKKTTNISEIAPEFENIISELDLLDTNQVQHQVTLLRDGSQETLFVRVSRSERRRSGNLIISFDVVSDLVHAQRMAAWGDVARRIAHEIKNPLTPIRLSAERLKRRFGKDIMDDREKFEDLTDIIVRQTEDLRKIVDEFSKFSRMPEAQREKGDWVEQLHNAIALQENNEDDVKIIYDGPRHASGFFDATMMGQAFTNIIKNGIEAIASRKQREDLKSGEIRINAELIDGQFSIGFYDNGMGFPADKSKLFEPYMTFKETGTGLGLPIVKKIIEDHDGKISLHDRQDNEKGACVQIKLPEHQISISKTKSR